MRDTTDNPTISYMLRYLIRKSITDPLSTEKRGVARTVQYFSGTNTASQINYLGYTPVSSSTFFRTYVYNSGTSAWDFKTKDTHYTVDVTNSTVTWTAFTPLVANDNIKVEFDSIKNWIFDDSPNFSSAYFPRISIIEQSTDVRGPFLGLYTNYAGGIGDLQTKIFVISVYAKEGMELTIDGRSYKNADIVEILAQQIKYKIHSNRVPAFWRFWDMKVTRMQRNRNNEESGVYAMDLTLECKYFDKAL